MPELLLTDKCNQTQHRFNIKWKPQKSTFLSREYIAAVAWDPCGGPGQIWTETYGFMVAGKKGPFVVWVPYTGSHGVVWCFSVLLHCIASRIHRLPYTGGRVSSISDSPISVTPSLKYWAAEKQKPKILGLDPISKTRFWLSGPQIWSLDSMAAWFCTFWGETRDL